MAPTSVKALLTAALATGVSAQATTETVWASVAYVLFGERTPLLGQTTASLTPYGAQQLHSQGELFKARYLANGSLSTTDKIVTASMPIVGIERRALDNDQLSIMSSTDDYVTGSALAFMQGLYPPITQAFASGNGGMNASVLANGSLINFPLDGYQYPNIQSLSILDQNSIWLEGHVTCTQYRKSSDEFRTDYRANEVYDNTYNFYQTLWTTTFAGTSPLSKVNFDYAYELYEYASYQYNHNETIHNTLKPEELKLLGMLADDQQFSLNGNLSASGLVKGDMIRAVAGRTLAAKVVAQLKAHIGSGGYSDKLSVMFGSYEPMMAFFALSDLSNGHSGDLFQTIPKPGSAMIFELFSVGSDTSSYPTNDDLWVRFLYRNGTEATAPFIEYPLFGRGNMEIRMRLADFTREINKIAITDLAGWCDTCDSINLFCSALKGNTGGGSTGVVVGSSGGVTISPAIAGVIGAAATLAVLGIAAIAAIVLGGLRLQRSDSGRKGSLGGFKGAEKLASDRDIAIAKSGAKHERVGSWELGGPGAPTVVSSKSDTVFGATFVRNEDDNDSIMGRAPVKPRESV